MMKHRAMKLLKECGEDAIYDEFVDAFDAEVKIQDTANEWVYMQWGKMKFHYNAVEDRLRIFVNELTWEEN